MSQPSARNASTRSPIGRSCMRGTPPSSNRPPCVADSSASTATSGRMAVPALPRNSVASCTRSRAPMPSMRSAPRASVRTVQPSMRKASSMTRVSSESSGACSSVLPSHRADEQQHAIGNALRTGQAHRPRRRAQRRNVEERDVEHRRPAPVDQASANASAPAGPAACPSATAAGLHWPRAAIPATPARCRPGSPVPARRAIGENAATASATLRGWR